MNSFFLLTVLSLGLNFQAQAKVIYGEDHRLEVFQSKPFHQKLAQSIVSMIPKRKMKTNLDGSVDFLQLTLGEYLIASFNDESDDEDNMSIEAPVTSCSEERFVNQPTPASCSGFLIAPDLLVTAGHCVVKKDSCKNNAWVFDFKVEPLNLSVGINVNPETIYSCKKVITSAANIGLGLDFAIVQLDRVVKGREPLEIRSEGIIEDAATLVVIGSPSGLPLKVADGANVRINSHPFFFETNTDTFQGNSGSPIINDVTGVVEGILVRGEDDFVNNADKNCIESKVCKMDDCMGEAVSRLTSIPEIAFKDILMKASSGGDVATLEKIISHKIWIDFNGKDGQTALMKAASQGQVSAMKVLIKAGADLNHLDSNGQSVLNHLQRGLNITAAQALGLIILLKNG